MAFAPSAEPLKSKVQRSAAQMEIDGVVLACYNAGTAFADTLRVEDATAVERMLKRGARFHGKRIVIERALLEDVEIETDETGLETTHDLVQLKFGVMDRRKRQVVVEGVVPDESDDDDDDDDDDENDDTTPDSVEDSATVSKPRAKRGRTRKVEEPHNEEVPATV